MQGPTSIGQPVDHGDGRHPVGGAHASPGQDLPDEYPGYYDEGHDWPGPDACEAHLDGPAGEATEYMEDDHHPGHAHEHAEDPPYDNHPYDQGDAAMHDNYDQLPWDPADDNGDYGNDINPMEGRAAPAPMDDPSSHHGEHDASCPDGPEKDPAAGDLSPGSGCFCQCFEVYTNAPCLTFAWCLEGSSKRLYKGSFCEVMKDRVVAAHMLPKSLLWCACCI